MLKHIIKLIQNQWRSNLWIWAEIVLVSVCLWYIVDDLYVKGTLYTSPLGYDITNVYNVDLNLITDEVEEYLPQESYGTTLGEDFLTLVDRIRTYPGVEAVGVSYASLPYSYHRNYTGITRITPEGDTLHIGRVRRYQALPEYIQVFRYATASGQTDVLVNNLNPNQIVISGEVEKALYPEGPATGKTVDYQMGADSLDVFIGGVMNPVRICDFSTYAPTFIRPMTAQMLAEEMNDMVFHGIDLTVRVAPGQEKDFPARFRKEMKNQLKYHNIYLLNVRSYEDIRSRYIRSNINNYKMYLAGVFFLLVNIFLGITGTFFFRTEHRQAEMGLRIALGSTAHSLRSLLIGEGLVLLVLAFIPAMLISVNIGLKEIVDVTSMPFTAGRFLVCQGISFLLMASMIAAGIWFPSRKAIHLHPAEALHYE